VILLNFNIKVFYYNPVNKPELIKFLRNPNKLTSSNLDELEDIIQEDPYFLSARLLLAKGSKELGDKKTKKRVASAAIYSTDRILLKKYLSSNLFFLERGVAEEPTAPPKAKRERVLSQSASVQEVGRKEKPRPGSDKRIGRLKVEKKGLSTPQVATEGLDALLDELKRDMENLKASRHHFAEVQQKIEEEDAVAKAIYKNKSEMENTSPPLSKERLGKAKPIQSKEEDRIKAAFKIELDPKEEEIFSKKLAKLSGKKEEKKKKPGAEKSIDKSRFSGFSTKSYFKNPKEDFKSDFDLQNKEKEKKDTIAKTGSPEEKDTKKRKKKIPERSTPKSRKSDKILSSKITEKKKTAGRITSVKENIPDNTKRDEPEKDRSKDNNKSDREKQKSIIDKFIKELPSIKYTGKEKIPTTDLAEPSASWDRNVSSEYLAEIYLSQGNKKRAKEVYESLILKYPEKIAYFTDLISKIE